VNHHYLSSFIVLPMTLSSTQAMSATPDDARTQSILLAAQHADISTLRKWSTEPGGLGPDAVRRKVW
jgi:hypothetical protein